MTRSKAACFYIILLVVIHISYFLLAGPVIVIKTFPLTLSVTLLVATHAHIDRCR